MKKKREGVLQSGGGDGIMGGMDITFLGGTGFKLAGKQVIVAIDPVGEVKSADVDVYTVEPAGAKVKGGIVFDGPGDYEVKGAVMTGFDLGGSTGFSFEIDDGRVCHLGGLNRALTDTELEQIGACDLLFVPVGEAGLEPRAASGVVAQIEPKIVVPMGQNKEAVAQFLHEMGASPEPVSKLRLVAKDLPEETTVVVMKLAGAE